jgi:cytidine deaminase
MATTKSIVQDTSKLKPEDIELIEIACQHAKERFHEGVTTIAGALRTGSGKIYTGINLKYRLRSISTCGEALAIYAALNAGETELNTIVGVKYFPETNSFEVVNGCGPCRQLYSYNLPLKAIIDTGGKLEVVTAEKLMPYAFL